MTGVSEVRVWVRGRDVSARLTTIYDLRSTIYDLLATIYGTVGTVSNNVLLPLVVVSSTGRT